MSIGDKIAIILCFIAGGGEFILSLYCIKKGDYRKAKRECLWIIWDIFAILYIYATNR